jgi:hypothetical protein
MIMLGALAILLFVLWIAGLALKVVGVWIHVLLLLAVAALLLHFIRGRGSYVP